LFLAETPEGPVLKILDFGISKDTGRSGRGGPRVELTHVGCAVGSPYYMSPEQMRASPLVDQRTDIWSLGAVLFELLTGKCPFDGESVQVVCGNVLNRDPPSLRGFSAEVPEELDAIVRCCLEKDPQLRYGSAGELAAALRGFATSERALAADLRLASGVSLIPNAAPSLPETRLAGSSPTLRSLADPGSARLAHAAAVVGRRQPARGRWALRLAAAGIAVWLGGDAMLMSQGRVAFGATASAPAARRSSAKIASAAPDSERTSGATNAQKPLLVSVTPERDPIAGRAALARTLAPARSAPVTSRGMHARKAPSAPASTENATLSLDPPELPAHATPLPKVTPPPEASAPPAASAAFDPQPNTPRARPPAVNAWSTDSLGGRY